MAHRARTTRSLVVMASALALLQACATADDAPDVQTDGHATAHDAQLDATRAGDAGTAQHDAATTSRDDGPLAPDADRDGAVDAEHSDAGSTGPSTRDLAAVHAMLANEAAHAWRDCDDAAHGYAYHGILVNWNLHEGHTVGNWNGSGQPDPDPCNPTDHVPAACWSSSPPDDCPRHEDRLTPLRFLHALLLYREDTGSSEFDATITRMTTHVLGLFTPANPDKRAWAYHEFADLFRLTHDARFHDVAEAMLASYASSPADDSRPDWQIMQSAALISSGESAYVTRGTAALERYWAAYFVPADNVVRAASPSPIKTSQQMDIAIALARAGMTDRARLLVQGLEAFRDPTLGGYCEGAAFDYARNRVGTLQTRKTGGRMMAMLELAKILGDASLAATMDALFFAHVYQASPAGYEGVVYEQRPDWTPYTLSGRTEDWATSEAMGIAMVALAMH